MRPQHLRRHAYAELAMGQVQHTYLGLQYCLNSAQALVRLAGIGALGGSLGREDYAARLSMAPARRRKRRARVRQALLVRKWVARFLAYFSGAATYLCITRSAQARLRVADFVFLRIQTQRLFACMPANSYQLRRLDAYP
jgi:hypothetical protein